MSRNGSGTYNLPAGNPVTTGTTITSSWANTTLSDIATALTGSVASDGQTAMSGDLNMATNKISNLANPTLAQDAATKTYVDTAISTGVGVALLKTNNLSDLDSASTARTNLGLGSMATQSASSVAITGGTVSGITGSINSVTPGGNSVGARTVSTSSPTGGSDGDIWYKV